MKIPSSHMLMDDSLNLQFTSEERARFFQNSLAFSERNPLLYGLSMAEELDFLNSHNFAEANVSATNPAIVPIGETKPFLLDSEWVSGSQIYFPPGDDSQSQAQTQSKRKQKKKTKESQVALDWSAIGRFYEDFKGKLVDSSQLSSDHFRSLVNNHFEKIPVCAFLPKQGFFETQNLVGQHLLPEALSKETRVSFYVTKMLTKLLLKAGQPASPTLRKKIMSRYLTGKGKRTFGIKYKSRQRTANQRLREKGRFTVQK